MTITTEEFVAGFHAISGTTVGERRKSLFLFLNGIDRSQSNNLDFSHLLPKNPLEEKFKLEALIYFRRIPDLLEVLKSENSILIERVLDVQLLLEEGFQNITGDELVTLIFPQISFNAKQKLLNKLVVHLKNAQADAYFAAVEKKYGFYLASKLLSACSPDLVLNCLKFKRIKLTPRQLLAIVKKNPEITESILKIINDKNVSLGEEYKNVFLYVAQNNVLLFWKLYSEYNLPLRLGWRSTHKFIQANRKDVIDNPKQYYNFLHNKQIVKSLNREFDQLYHNLFPKSLEKLNTQNTVFSMIEKLPKKMKNKNLLFMTFEKVYGSQLWDHEQFRDIKIFKMLPPNERESKSALEYKPSRTSEEEWYCYMKTEKSIPYLLKKISLTSDIGKRVELVRLLPKTCYINEDKAALLNMCKYMLKKHRNDNASVRRGFLTKLMDNFKLEHLDEEHWIAVNELIQLFTLNKESFDDAAYFLEGYIHYSLIHSLPVKKLLTEWITAQNSLNIIKTQPRYEKHCLLSFGKIIPELFSKKKEEAPTDGDNPMEEGENPIEEMDSVDEQEELKEAIEETDRESEEEEKVNSVDGEKEEDVLDRKYMNFVRALISWNCRHPEDPISILSHSFAVSSINQNITKENDRYNIAEVIKYCLSLKTNLEERSNLLNSYITKSTHYVDAKIIEWLAQNDPLTVIKNIDAVARFALQKYYYRGDESFIWRWWRNYTHLENFENPTIACLSEFEKSIKESPGSSHLSHAVTGLSYLLTGEQFRKFIEPFYPSGLQADAKNKKNEVVYTIQTHIGPVLKNLKPSSLALESLSRFCKGDYLKLAQKSLYSVCSNVNESELAPFFGELAGRAVSTRKHAMHLSFRLLNKEQRHKLLNKFMETEKNASVRKFIFKGVFNLFVQNADDYSWEMVKENVNAIDVSDKEALEILMKCEKIPLQYIVPYVVFAWGVLNKLPDSDSDKECHRSSLLRLISPEVINAFPKEFCKDIIEKYFFKSDDASLTMFQSDVNTLTCRYIIYCNSLTEQEDRIKSNFEVIQKFVLGMWHRSDIQSSVRNYVGAFLQDFCSEFLTKRCENTAILVKFSNLWNSLFKIHQAVDEYLHLQLTLIYIEKLTLPQIAERLAGLCDSLAAVYGFAIVDTITKKINSFAQYILSSDQKKENWYVLFENLILPDKSVHCQVLVILLLNDHLPSTSKTRTKYETIIEILKVNPDPVVQLYLESHYRRC